MTRFKNALFLATVASSAILACSAQAQTNINPPANNNGETVLHGAGASSIQNVLVQELNCIGNTHFPLGLIGGSTVATGFSLLPEPTDLPYATSGAFDCSSQYLEPNFAAKYVATGSGFGRTAWTTAGNAFATSGANSNPFEQVSDATLNPTLIGWSSGVQFAFSDGNASSGDLTNYTNNVSSVAGPAVFFPKYVLPVAVAYNPVYGKNGSGASMSFHVANPQSILGVTAGGLPLNATTYCRIFNGDAVNWNDAAITADNGGTPLFDTTNDTSTRWTDEGVPIRLVGRLDRSGTTDIFTRHLAAICPSALSGTGVTNKFAARAETLPYSRGVAGTPDFASVRPDTGLSSTSTAGTAGTTNSVSNTYYVGGTTPGFSSVSGGTSAAPVISGSLVNGVGLFIVANGSGGVTDAINFGPDYVAPSGATLNGKVGYIGSDFVVPAPNAGGLFSAALKGSAGVGSASAYHMPSAAEARAAFGITVLPPQTNSSGTFVPGNTARGLRSDPLAWTNALYFGTGSLASPSSGYPITGTTQFAGYTCYKTGNADAVRNFLGWNMETITTDWQGNGRAGVFTTDGASTFSGSGLLARSNIGVMPNNWQAAVDQSFLSGSDGLGLQIRDVAAGGVCSGLTGR